jgi:hypothetical protein
VGNIDFLLVFRLSPAYFAEEAPPQLNIIIDGDKSEVFFLVFWLFHLGL